MASYGHDTPYGGIRIERRREREKDLLADVFCNTPAACQSKSYSLVRLRVKCSKTVHKGLPPMMVVFENH